MNQRSGIALRVAAQLEAVAFQILDDGIGIEILHAHAQMINTAARCGRRAASAAASAEHEKLDTVSGAQERRIGVAGRSLITLNAPAEQILIELVRPVGIR